jgi:hypothetical protein
VRGGAALVLGAVALAGSLSGCETTAEKSAQLEKSAHHVRLNEQGLSVTRQSADIQVLGAILVRGTEGAAAVLTLRNVSGHALQSVPIAITVKDARGNTLFQNNAPGLEAALTSMALLEPGAPAIWVDDQVQASKAATSVSALAGEAEQAPTRIPRLQITGTQKVSESGSSPAASGTVTNDSAIVQHNLVVYAVAQRNGRIIGAGRAIVPEVAAHHSSQFEVFFVGAIGGAQLQFSAPPTTLG